MARFVGALKPKDDTSKRLGEVFRWVRETKKFTRKQVADRLGHSPFLIRRHEYGTVMLRTDDLVKAAEIMEVEPRLLLGDTTDG